MLCSYGAQHNKALVPEQDQGVPQPSPANHSPPGDELSIERPEILPRSKSNQILPRGYVLTAKIVQTCSLSALQCLAAFSKSPHHEG